MKGLVLRILQRTAAIVLRLSSPRLAPGIREEIADTAREACAEAWARGGVAAMCAAVAAELTNLAGMPIRRWLGIDPQVTEPRRIPRGHSRGGHVLVDDFRRASKRLRSGAGTLALTVGMLALAIGVTAAMFTVLDALVLHPVPFEDPARLTRVVVGVNHGRAMISTTPPSVINAWRASGAFERIEGAIPSRVVLDGDHEPIARSGAHITPGMLAMLGVRPILGRDFTDGEGRTGTDDRLLLSEELWASQFSRDPAIIGRRIRVSGRHAEVIGILPAAFRFPTATTVLWQPVDLNAPPASTASARALAFGRLAANLPTADAQRLADQGFQVTAPEPGQHTMFRPVAAGMVDAYSRRVVKALSVGVALVFFVLCANAMNLMLTRFATRQREFCVCSALGASRSRLLREALAEAALIGAAALLLGLLVANGLVAVSAHLLPEPFLASTLTPVAVSGRALAVTSILGALAAAIAGITPAWMATRADTARSFRPAVHGATASGSARRLTRGLLVGEIALATTLLACAALLVRTFQNLAGMDRGLSVEGVVTAWVSLPEFDFQDPAGRLTFASAMEARLKELPWLQRVTLSNGVPPGSAFVYFGRIRAEATAATEMKLAELKVYSVTPGFFELFQIPFVAGRTFSDPSPFREVIVGERLARMLWPDGVAAGRTFRMGSGSFLVVGVVNEISNPSADPRLDPPELYFPLVVEKDGRGEASALERGEIFVALRCVAACPALSQIREAIRAAAPRAVIASLGPLEEEYSKLLARPRAAATLAASFGLIALTAAAGGMFGVLAAAVARRRREFGIRIALGIEPGRLRHLVMKEAWVVAGIGVATGVFGAWALGRGLAALTFEVSPADPRSWMAVAVALALSVVAAAWIPAAQAARTDPTLLLRDDT